MSPQPAVHRAAGETVSALRQQLYTLVGRAVKEVRLTRVNWPDGKRWVATVFGLNGKEVPLYDRGLHHQAAMVLKEAFPQANWAVAQDYDVKSGVLREHVVRMPACLQEDVD
ncbi:MULTISPECIES: hypothetical protein [unclassified Streptomyces]|uniref:hypothetical protein n=1 Tax=unclassified Streptomyces TaxID=2593676 RepID=UPI000FFEEB15|nr:MULTISPECIES: hypothetical protein [unclassified Streptomyces]